VKLKENHFNKRKEKRKKKKEKRMSIKLEKIIYHKFGLKKEIENK